MTEPHQAVDRADVVPPGPDAKPADVTPHALSDPRCDSPRNRGLDPAAGGVFEGPNPATDVTGVHCQCQTCVWSWFRFRGLSVTAGWGALCWLWVAVGALLLLVVLVS